MRLFVAIGMVLFLGTAKGQIIISTLSSHVQSIDENNLNVPGEAGSDIASQITTASNFNQLDILNMGTTRQWKVSVSRYDIHWPAAFSLSVKRTSNGIACGGCAGINLGASPAGFVTINLSETDFIFGSGEVVDINLQFQISGLSLTVPADSYMTEIVYTLYGD